MTHKYTQLYVDCDYGEIDYVKGDLACRTTDVRPLYSRTNKEAFWAYIRKLEIIIKGYK